MKPQENVIKRTSTGTPIFEKKHTQELERIFGLKDVRFMRTAFAIFEETFATGMTWKDFTRAFQRSERAREVRTITRVKRGFEFRRQLHKMPTARKHRAIQRQGGGCQKPTGETLCGKQTNGGKYCEPCSGEVFGGQSAEQANYAETATMPRYG